MQAVALCSRAPGRSSPSHSSQGLAGVGVSPPTESATVQILGLPLDSRLVLGSSSDQGTSKKSVLHIKMSRREGVDVSQLRHKRLKALPATSSTEEENERPRVCYCFEKNDCVVRKLREKRLKESSSVRRKLDFGAEEGPVADLFAQSRDESSKVWNFDFEEEVPLAGSWSWTKEGHPPAQSKEESDESRSESVRHKTLKDLFRVSKSRSQKRSLDNQFRLTLAPLRTTETSPA